MKYILINYYRWLFSTFYRPGVQMSPQQQI